MADGQPYLLSLTAVAFSTWQGQARHFWRQLGQKHFLKTSALVPAAFAGLLHSNVQLYRAGPAGLLHIRSCRVNENTAQLLQGQRPHQDLCACISVTYSPDNAVASACDGHTACIGCDCGEGRGCSNGTALLVSPAVHAAETGTDDLHATHTNKQMMQSSTDTE